MVTPQFVVYRCSKQSFKTIPGPWETLETLLEFPLEMKLTKPLCCFDLCFIPKIIAEITYNHQLRGNFHISPSPFNGVVAPIHVEILNFMLQIHEVKC